jgi:hypothetical protein
MRFVLIVLCCIAVSFSASAQWWHVNLKKHDRLPLISQVQNHSIALLPVARIKPVKIYAYNFKPSDYSLELAEAIVMKTAQHNMRFRIYDVASYNFSDLAQLYVQENRLSEAKWYFLQSNNISRQQNNDKHTFTNLLGLALIKTNLGEVALAQQDLAEARQIAITNNWLFNVVDVDNEIKYIQLNKNSTPKTELRYADAAATDKKTD